MTRDTVTLPTNPPSPTMMGRLKYLWDYYIRFYKWTLLISILAGAAAALTGGFGFPFMIDKVFPIVFERDQLPKPTQEVLVSIFGAENLHEVVVWAAACFLPAVVVVRGIASYVNAYCLTSAGLRVLERFRTQLYSRFQTLSLSYHEKNKSGDLLSRLMHDTQFLQEGVMQVANDMILQPMTLLGALGYLVYKACGNQQFLILLVNMILVGFCIIPIQRIGKRMLNQARKAQAGLGDITASLQENLASQRDIRAYGMESEQIKHVRFQIRDFLKTMLNVVKWQNLLTPMVEISSAIALAIALYVGSSNGMEVKDFISLATAMYLCYDPVKRLGSVHNRLAMNMAIVDRFNEVIFQPDDMPDPEQPRELKSCRGDIKFDHVRFAYDGNKIVLNDVNVHIPAGQIVALVGPSGAGKTTFANLVCRFYDVNEGSVKLDEIDVREYRKKDLMRQIAYVSQYPVLFRGTVEDNIRIGKPEASQCEVIQAGRRAVIDDIVREDAGGYQRMIGESGEGLSGGQKQRVSIARAFLKNAPVLILDEATASLDMRSEFKIQKQLESLATGRTTLIIAHRFSTIRMAHRLLVFEQGRIIADGTHQELYQTSPLYRDLYDKQQMHNKEETP